MAAVVLNSFGALAHECMSVDTMAQMPRQPIGNEVLVRVRAASINPLDVRMMEGYGRNMIGCSRELPVVLGRDVSGEVCAVGADVLSLKPGHRVWGAIEASKSGSFAEYVLLTANEASRMPKSFTFAQAAALPFVVTTARNALSGFLAADSFEGKRVFVHGGSGPLGRFVVQLLTHLGCEVGVSCSAKNAPDMLAMGCVLVVDYQTQNFDDAIAASSWGAGGIDFFMDNVGVKADPSVEDSALTLLAVRKGRFATALGPVLNKTDEEGLILGLAQSAAELLHKKQRFLAHGVSYDWILADPMSASNSQFLKYVASLADEGFICPKLHDQVFVFPDGVIDAMGCERERRATGKVVVYFD
jgi:NADPH:quinone reductase-like Zn-dependent oxidoreductase